MSIGDIELLGQTWSELSADATSTLMVSSMMKLLRTNKNIEMYHP